MSVFAFFRDNKEDIESLKTEYYGKNNMQKLINRKKSLK